MLVIPAGRIRRCRGRKAFPSVSGGLGGEKSFPSSLVAIETVCDAVRPGRDSSFCVRVCVLFLQGPVWKAAARLAYMLFPVFLLYRGASHVCRLGLLGCSSQVPSIFVKQRKPKWSVT